MVCYGAPPQIQIELFLLHFVHGVPWITAGVGVDVGVESGVPLAARWNPLYPSKRTRHAFHTPTCALPGSHWIRPSSAEGGRDSKCRKLRFLPDPAALALMNLAAFADSVPSRSSNCRIRAS